MKYLLTIALLLLFVLLLFSMPAWAVSIDSLSTSVNLQTQQATFQMRFNSAPDFFTVDQFGRQKDSFQVYAFDSPTPPNTSYEHMASVTRGEEIHVGDGLPLRNVFLDSPDGGAPPGTSGGWGSVREIVPFTLDANTLTYNVSLVGLGDGGDGKFSYNVDTFSFGLANASNWALCASGLSGSPSSFCTDTNPPIGGGGPPVVGAPEPPTVWLMAIGMIGLAGFVAWRQRKGKEGG